MKESIRATWLILCRTGDKAYGLSVDCSLLSILVSIGKLVDVGMAMLYGVTVFHSW